MVTLLVDAMNVIGSRPDGWWRDRPAAVRALVAKLRVYAAVDGVDVAVFVDGAIGDGTRSAGGRVEVYYAENAGRDAADDRMIEFVDSQDDRSVLHAVTSDRALTGRLRARGVQVYGAAMLLEQLDALE